MKENKSSTTTIINNVTKENDNDSNSNSNNKNTVLEPNQILNYIFNNQNPFPNIHPQLTLAYIAEQAALIYGNKPTPLSKLTLNKISLVPVDEEFKQVLDGGFRLGYSYEIKGPSLSGKTLLINTLLFSNMNRIKKCLFFDFIGTNLWKIDWENKIEVIDTLYSITEVINFIKTIPIGKYDVVVFDPLSVILSKELEYSSQVIQEFNNEIDILLYKKNTTVIYTSSVKLLDTCECRDEKTKRVWIEREYESLTPLLFIPINKTEICLYRKHQDERQLFFVGNLYAHVIGIDSSNDYIELPSLSG